MKTNRITAIAIITKAIADIVYESQEDTAAAEWEGHLEDIRDQLASETIAVEEASRSLGMNLDQK